MEENTVNEVTLKVMEALQEEAYKGIVRIDTETMRDIGVRIGDIVEIEGGRKTVGIVDRAYPTDIGQTVIRMDGILRRNAKTGIGEVVKVRRAAVKEAKTVTIAPAQKGVTIKVDPNMFKRGLLGRAVVKGDILALGGTRRRRSAMSDNPFFEDVFQMFEEDFMGGFGIAGLRFVVADGFPKSALVITEATDLKFSTKAIDVLEEKVPYITYEDIGGLTDEIEKVREMVELPLKHPELFERLGIEPPKGILLHGPPGCGKTLLAKAVANESDATFLLINGPEVVSKFVGEAEKKIREKFEEAEKKAPSILFIDEIDAIASKREESYGEVEKRMVAQLLATMDGMQERGKVIVIAATNRPNSIDPALRRPGRFDREIVIGVPSKEGRLNVLKIHTRNMPLKPQIKKAYVERGIVKFTDKLHDLIEKLDSKKIKIEGEPAVKAEIEEVKEYLTVLKDFYKLLKADLKENEKSWETVPMAQRDKLRPILIEGMLSEFASRTHGFVGADLAALCKEAAINVIRRVLKKDISLKENQPLAKEVLDKLIILDTDFEEAMRIVIPSGMREVMVEIPNVGWNDIGGLEDIKRDLKEAIEWPLKYPQRFKDMGIRAPRGVLLYGPPGCGKTMLAKAVAHESEANFILVKGPELLNMWIGESLPYDEKLIVKKDGIITRMKIGEIVETKADVEVLCFDKQKRVIFSKIQDHIKHKATSQLVEVKTKSGRKIRVTQDHSLFTFVNGKVVSLPTSYLIPGESHIAVPKSLHLPRETMKHINLYEGFRRDTNVFVGNVSDSISKAIKILGKKPVAKKLHVSVKYLDDILSKKLPVSLPLFDTVMHESGLQIKTEELTIKLKGSTHSYPALFSIDPSFWRLVGLWVAEGDFNGYTVRLHNQNLEIRSDMEMICKKYDFNISANSDCFSINSLLMQKVFSSLLGLEAGAEHKKIPGILFGLDKESKAAFLKGYFSGDGSNSVGERGKCTIEAGTISLELADDLMYLLLDFGIVSRHYTKLERTGSTTHRIVILGVENYEKFLDIGFIDTLRNSRIGEYIQSRQFRRSDLIPLNGELSTLAGKWHNDKNNQTLGKERLQWMLLQEENSREKFKEYWDLVEGDLYFDLVKEITLLDTPEFVYDVSVPDGQNFIGGFGGIFAHNSEKGVREIFKKARQVAPTVIFFDEIDSIATRRGLNAGNTVTERMVNTLLTEIDGLEELHNVIVIAATNRPDMLDPALLRPGRFDRVLLTPLPDEKARLEIFKLHTKNMPLAKNVNLKNLVEKTINYVGSDIEGVCREAGMLALRNDIKATEISMEHFENALDKVKASVRTEDMKRYQEIEESYIRTARGAEIHMRTNYFG